MAGCKATFVSSLLLLLPAMVAAQFPVPPAPADVAPVASYDMDVRLDPEEHTASGSEVVTWNSPAVSAATTANILRPKARPFGWSATSATQFLKWWEKLWRRPSSVLISWTNPTHT